MVCDVRYAQSTELYALRLDEFDKSRDHTGIGSMVKILYSPVMKIVLTENYDVRQYYMDSRACPITFVAIYLGQCI
jgi:hypothetical protein